jgi:hypothetical protein
MAVAPGVFYQHGVCQTPTHVEPYPYAYSKIGFSNTTQYRALEQKGCHITTGKDYNFGYVDSYWVESFPGSENQVARWISGATPVMTLFFDQPGQQNDITERTPEAHLNCLLTLPVDDQKKSSSAAITKLSRTVVLPLATMLLPVVAAILT